MAHHHLPPKAPNWPLPTTNHTLATWAVDDFLDFSSARRGSHRRSMSDSIAFLDSPMADQCRHLIDIDNANSNNNNNVSEFERFDDDQLMSMFADVDVGPALSNDPSSSPSDHNSINDDDKPMMPMMMMTHQQQELKTEPDEVESSCKSDGPMTGSACAPAAENSSEKIVDPKRIKRILANRQSAQRSRVRKLQYISELERSVTSLQAEVSVLSPRVAFLDHQRLVLNVDNSVLKQRIAALAQDKLFKDAHQEALKREIERLRQIYYEQNLKKMDNGSKSPSTTPDKDQLVAATIAPAATVN